MTMFIHYYYHYPIYTHTHTINQDFLLLHDNDNLVGSIGDATCQSARNIAVECDKVDCDCCLGCTKSLVEPMEAVAPPKKDRIGTKSLESLSIFEHSEGTQENKQGGGGGNGR